MTSPRHRGPGCRRRLQGRALLGCLAIVLAGLPDRGDAAETNVPAGLFAPRNGLAWHAAAYTPRRLAWGPLSAVEGVRAVFPHPEVAATVYVIAADGLHRSDDDARTWRRLPLAGAAALGSLSTLVFRPGEPETLCLGSASNGVWVSRDGGQSARKLGGRGTGMASDVVTDLVFTRDDSFPRTLIVAHGGTAPGLSRGDIEEGTWSVLAPDYHVYRAIPGGLPDNKEFYLFAAEKATPDTVGLYRASPLGTFWQRLQGDFMPTDGVRVPGRDQLVVTSLDKGVLRAAERGGVFVELGGADAEWFSAGVTWGSHADDLLLYLYEPGRRGLAWTTNDLAGLVEQGAGLYRGAFVSEGSHIRANAGGTRFYGAINGGLWVGLADNPFRVDTVAATPAVVTIAEAALDESRWRSYDEDVRDFTAAVRAGPLAGDLVTALTDLNGAIPNGQVTLRARVVAPSGTVPRVTADLSRFGLASETPLADDGRHHDGAAADGLYGLAFDVTREGLRHPTGEWRPTWPGPMPISVTARDPAGACVGAVGVFSLYTRPESFTFWKEGRGIGLRDVVGTAALEVMLEWPKGGPRSWHLRLAVGPGVWQAPMGYGRMKQNIADYYALTFLIRSQGPADGDLSVHLRDNPLYTVPTVTPGVALVAGGYLPGGVVTGEYRRVTVPVADLLKGGEGYMADLTGWVVFSGDSPTRRTYLLRDIRFVVSRKELEQEGRAP